MALDDLDLEFEDEEEAKKKKSDAVQVDVDLEFQAPEGGGKARPVVKPVHAGGTAQGSGPRPMPGGQVKSLDEARTSARRPPGAPGGPRPVTAAGTAALNERPYDLESEDVVAMRERMQKVEFEAAVKVAVAEYKTELLSELLGDMKLMEHQVGQLITRINAKHPDMKQEVLMIKKILADFTAKKRK